MYSLVCTLNVSLYAYESFILFPLPSVTFANDDGVDGSANTLLHIDDVNKISLVAKSSLSSLKLIFMNFYHTLIIIGTH